MFVHVFAFSSLLSSGEIEFTIIIYLYNPHEIVQVLQRKNCMIPQSTNIYIATIITKIQIAVHTRMNKKEYPLFHATRTIALMYSAGKRCDRWT